MDKEEFASDSDQSDDDYCPDRQDTDILSEEETDDEIDEKSLNSIKTTKKQNGRKRSKKRNIKKSEITPESSSSSQKLSEPENNQKCDENEESEKARADALWADFLGDTKTEKKSKTFETNSKPIEKMKVTEVFDFAGEEVKITKEIQIDKLQKNIPEKIPSTIRNSTTTTSSRIPLKRPASSGGLSSVLGQIGKKNKISVLEKTKLDWDHFKKEKNLNEELKTFNKGKDGYLERQDFLQRTDVRQFEIEKSLRQTKRSTNR